MAASLGKPRNLKECTGDRRTLHYVFRYFPQGILASTLSSKLTCANYHRLGVVARAGERGSRARNANCIILHYLALRIVAGI